MTPTKKNKLQDYILGLHELKKAVHFPIGAVVVKEKDKVETIKALKEEGLSPISTNEGDHPDLILSKLIDEIQKGEMAALDLSVYPLHSRIALFLSDLSQNKIDITLAGGKRIFMSALPKNAQLLLIFTTKDFEAVLLPNVISSVCRL